MVTEETLHADTKVYPTIILTKDDIVDDRHPTRRSIRTIRRLHRISTVEAAVLEIELLKSSSHSKSITETIEGLPITLKNLSWLHVNGKRHAIVLHDDLEPKSRKELLEAYRLNKNLLRKDIEVEMVEQADIQTVRKFLIAVRDMNQGE